MKQLISTLKSAMEILLCCISFMACTEDDLKQTDNDHSNPIRLFVSGPENGNAGQSRAMRETFANGDGIHIQTDFTLDGDEIKTVYSFLTYEDGKWTETDTETFNWPWNAVKASFTAYYIPSAGNYANGNKLNDSETSLSLSDLSKENNDPLMATYTEVPAGSSVYLQFAHQLSKVTFTNLKGVTNGEELRLIVSTTNTEGMKVNAFDTWKIQLKDKKELNVTQTTVTDYIANPAANEGKTVTFLVPTSPAKTNLRLTNKQMSILHAFDLPESLSKGLEAGKHYTIDASKLHDNFVSGDINEAEWNTDDAITLIPQEIGDYLTGVSEGKPFSVIRGDKTIQILVTYTEGNKSSIVAQIRDVDFNNGEFTPPAQVYQNVTFYGNNHYIKNVDLQQIKENCKAIFATNKGSMQDLIIENVKTTNAITGEKNFGILAGINDGTMDNIRIKGTVSLTAGPNTQHIGSLVGMNHKNVQNCSVSGTLTLTVGHNSSNTISVGGLTGYTTGNDSKLENCQIEIEKEASSITVSGTSTSNAFVGGMTGQNTEGGTVSNCRTNLPLTIQKNAHIYVGGMAGMALASLEQCTTVSDITCSGSSLDAESVTVGGFAGTQRIGNITHCASIGSINGTFTGNAKIGGFTGYINPNNADTGIKYSSATGSVTDNVAGMVGIIEPNGKQVTIDNSFCLKGTSFTKTQTDGNITISNCHINGKIPGSTDTFIPSDGDKDNWTIEPPIYGALVYYMKR